MSNSPRTTEVMVQRVGIAEVELPEYATPGSAGFDLRAAIDEPVTIHAGQRTAIPTGIAVALPEGFELQIRPRSGLAIRSGITMINSPGTVDSDFRGEIKVLIINHGDADFTVEPGDRIAQGVLARYERADWTVVDELPDSSRGQSGFGSTGKS